MGVPNSKVGYNSATARRGDHESSYEHVMVLKKIVEVSKPIQSFLGKVFAVQVEQSSVTLL